MSLGEPIRKTFKPLLLLTCLHYALRFFDISDTEFVAGAVGLIQTKHRVVVFLFTKAQGQQTWAQVVRKSWSSRLNVPTFLVELLYLICIVRRQGFPRSIGAADDFLSLEFVSCCGLELDTAESIVSGADHKLPPVRKLCGPCIGFLQVEKFQG